MVRGVQKFDDKKIIKDLDNRAAGKEKKSDKGGLDSKYDAQESANEHFKNAYGSINMASDVIDKVVRNINEIFEAIKNGQIQATEGIQNSMNDEHRKKEVTKSALLAVGSIFTAWLGPAAQAVSNAEARITQKLLAGNPNLKIKSINLPTTANVIKALGNSKYPSAINSTISGINSMIKTQPSSAESSIRSSVLDLSSKAQFAVHSAILDIARNSVKPDEKVSYETISDLKSEIHKEVLTAIFPYYSAEIQKQSFSGIEAKAKNEMLKNIIMNSGMIADGKIKGNKNKEGNELVSHALNAIGGEKNFQKELKSPYEFAFASLKSSLTNMGLEIDVNKMSAKEASDGNLLSSNTGFHVKVKNINSFREFLDEKRVVSYNHYSVKNGPMKDKKSSYTDGWEWTWTGRKYVSHFFHYDQVNFNDLEAWAHPSQQKSIMEGKVIDIRNFTLKLNSSGNATVMKHYADRTGVSKEKSGTVNVNGLNHLGIDL